ncbi:MAG: TlpA family protein disulfide reductase [Acidobacteriota bacterium]|nr:MAG: TlpA family protein disulfide reductase [Acidobacteriota bacterium]
MRSFLIFVFAMFILSACRPSAAPVAVSDAPSSINDRPTTNLPVVPTKPIRDMSWTDLDEKVHKLGDFQGKAVILDFWATYCEPCKRAIPHLNSLVEKHGADNLYIVGLNVGGEEDSGKIPKFLETTKIDYLIAFPEDALTRFVFAERSDIPQTIVFDRKGNQVTKLIGFSPPIQKQLDEAVEMAVNSQP